MLEKRTLGRSGLEVTALGFGSAPLGDLYGRLDDATATATVVEAHGAGMNLFDTSPHYGNGLAEHRIGAALRRVAGDVVLSTKVGRWMDPRSSPAAPARGGVAAPGFAGGLPHRSVLDYSYDGAMRSFEQSLLRLGVERIDILLIHDVDVWTHGPDRVETHFREAMEGAYRALVRLKDEGVVRAIGVGINEAAMCERFARSGDFDVMLLAGRYTLLDHEALDGFLALAQEKKIALMLAGIFNSGILATGAVPGAHYNYRPAPPAILERVARIETVCGAHGVALKDAAMRFSASHPAVACLLLGAVTPQEVRENVSGFSASIPPSLWSDLKSEGLLPAHAPTPG